VYADGRLGATTLTDLRCTPAFIGRCGRRLPPPAPPLRRSEQ
jgi:hypothetical protein